MKAARVCLVCLICVPMGICIVIAYLLGMLIRHLNGEPELDPYDGQYSHHAVKQDGPQGWFL